MLGPFFKKSRRLKVLFGTNDGVSTTDLTPAAYYRVHSL